MEKKTQKAERIMNTVSADQRAKGIKLPHGNPNIVAVTEKSAAKLPTSLVAVFEKIESKGKEGIKLESLRVIESLGASRHIQWKVRTLVKMGFVKAIAEPKPAAKPKELSIKNAVAASRAQHRRNEQTSRKKSAKLAKAA
jgi:hypothetical protein